MLFPQSRHGHFVVLEPTQQGEHDLVLPGKSPCANILIPRGNMTPVYNARTTFFQRECNAALNREAANHISLKKASKHPDQERRATPTGINILFDKDRNKQLRADSQKVFERKRKQFFKGPAQKRSCGWDRGSFNKMFGCSTASSTPTILQFNIAEMLASSGQSAGATRRCARQRWKHN